MLQVCMLQHEVLQQYASIAWPLRGFSFDLLRGHNLELLKHRLGVTQQGVTQEPFKVRFSDTWYQFSDTRQLWFSLGFDLRRAGCAGCPGLWQALHRLCVEGLGQP